MIPKTRLIHALDIVELDKAKKVAEAVSDYVDMVKVSYPSIIRNGGGFIGEIKRICGKPVLACFKIADTPDMSRRIMKEAILTGADGVTLHGIFSREALGECIKLAEANGIETYVVAEMSQSDFDSILGRYKDEISERIASAARDSGATGIVAPATKPHRVKRLREIVGDEMSIISPGVGAQGGKIGDAILAGADFEIIGRLIYSASDPHEKIKKIYTELKQRLREKAEIKSADAH
jgi:orotidine-5'-phosphate decarboxylase